ncbi:MAG TPA: hypothetical protein VEC17_00055, partial [Candidatus Binatia bacterium]|nr:hypothetical protein [Candidatus Binatia bacterium]
MPYEPKPIPKGFYIEKDKEHEKIRLIRLKKDPRRVVKKKMTHPRAHNDEAQASMDLSRYGENLYPGISNARVIYADDPRNVDPYKEFRDNGTLCFGIGKYFLDDHNYSGMGVCTTDLVNLHLGVKYPITLKYSDFTRHCDRTKMVLPMEWPTLLKGQYRTEPQNDVFRRAERLHIDFHWFEGGKRPANAKPFRLREYANMLEAEFAGHPGKKGLQRLTNYLREAEDVLDYDIRLSPQENQGRTRPYELARILRIMHALTTWEDYKKT